MSQEKTKVGIGTDITINAYKVVAEAVENGVNYGIKRAYKHTDHPSEAELVARVTDEVLNALCEVLIFGDSLD